MDQMDDEIMTMFVEDTREHLADIESALMDMERGGADIDEELVNKVFRAAHSIKGGASFLNLNNVRDLAHKLENILHMVRSREMVPDTRVINRLLAGFDRLLQLVEDVAQSDAQDIAAMLESLSGLAAENLPSEARAEAAAVVPVALPGGEVVFAEDLLSLRQAASGGKNLYLVEYDLIHDVQARGKTPLDVITTMESSGLIVDCRMELGAVGDLDAPPVNRIPFYVLFASIVEPDIVSYLFALDPARIHPVDVAALAAAAAPVGKAAQGSGNAACEAFGPFALCLKDGQAQIALAAGEPADAAAARLALLAALDRGIGAVLVWNDPETADLALLQVLVAAGRSFAARGLPLAHRDGAPRALAETAVRAGITPQSLAEAGLPADLLLAS
jgi:two-component system chemotaxis sensor kinase CheA